MWEIFPADYTELYRLSVTQTICIYSQGLIFFLHVDTYCCLYKALQIVNLKVDRHVQTVQAVLHVLNLSTAVYQLHPSAQWQNLHLNSHCRSIFWTPDNNCLCMALIPLRYYYVKITSIILISALQHCAKKWVNTEERYPQDPFLQTINSRKYFN